MSIDKGIVVIKQCNRWRHSLVYAATFKTQRELEIAFLNCFLLPHCRDLFGGWREVFVRQRPNLCDRPRGSDSKVFEVRWLQDVFRSLLPTICELHPVPCSPASARRVKQRLLQLQPAVSPVCLQQTRTHPIAFDPIKAVPIRAMLEESRLVPPAQRAIAFPLPPRVADRDKCGQEE